MSDPARSPAIYRMPLFGALIRMAVQGPDAPLIRLALVLAIGIIVVALFGYPGLITLALIGAFGMLGMLIVITRAR
ncbi:MAG: hypothetical protein ACI9ZH_002109 [Paracoccaceae bacterium]|jgi:hypothetical protein